MTGADQPTERVPVVTDDDVTVVIPAQTETMPDETVPDGTVPNEIAADETKSVARNSSIMAVGSLVSRITGFARAAVIAAALGTAIGNSYQLAVSLPQMIYELLVGGILTSVVVPLIVKARKADADGGEAFTHRLVTAAALMLGIATISAVLLAPVLTVAVRQRADDRRRPRPDQHPAVPDVAGDLLLRSRRRSRRRAQHA